MTPDDWARIRGPISETDRRREWLLRRGKAEDAAGTDMGDFSDPMWDDPAEAMRRIARGVEEHERRPQAWAWAFVALVAALLALAVAGAVHLVAWWLA